MTVDDCGTRSDNSDANTACQVGEADHDTSREELVALSFGLLVSIPVFVAVSISQFVDLPALWLTSQENGNDDSVNGDSFTEDNGDEVLGSNSWSLD